MRKRTIELNQGGHSLGRSIDIQFDHRAHESGGRDSPLFRRTSQSLIVGILLGAILGGNFFDISTSGEPIDALPDNDAFGIRNLEARPKPASPSECPPHRTLRTDGATKTFRGFIDAALIALDFASKEITTGSKRPIEHLAQKFDEYHTIEGGFWAEFGVYKGGTLELARDELSKSPSFTGTIAGFDSFEGLPEDWTGIYKKDAFALSESEYDQLREKLPDDVKLYKGWFQDTIPSFKDEHPDVPAAVVHHDGDLFLSTTIALQLLHDRIRRGTHMIFDELVGYPGYEKHEILALWLWMTEHNVTVCAMGHMGPMNATLASKKLPWRRQSAWLQVISL